MDSATPFPARAAAAPRLRLVRGGPARSEREEQNTSAAPPARVSEATDPRWVLAVRTVALLEGPVLVPEKRQRLLATGAALGLSPFDTALVIAIVQDQARRGVAPRQCPAAAEPQLRLVSRPAVRRMPWRTALAGAAVVVLLEAALVAWWLLG